MLLVNNFKKIVSPSSLSINGLQAMQMLLRLSGTRIVHSFFRLGNMPKCFVNSRANSNSPLQQNQVVVDNRVNKTCAGVSLIEHCRTNEDENNQQRQLFDALDPSNNDNWPQLSRGLIPGVKSKQRINTVSDRNLKPRQIEQAEQDCCPEVEPLFDKDSASQTDGSFNGTTFSGSLHYARDRACYLPESKSFHSNLLPDHNRSVGGYGISRQKLSIILSKQFEQMSNEPTLLGALDAHEPPFKPNFDRQPNNQRPRRNGNQTESRMGVKHSGENKPFDIFIRKRRNRTALNPSPPFDNDLKSIEFNHFSERNAKVLMPGMVILKRYIPLTLQVNIALRCREYGLRNGGFYQPGYKDGGKLRLHMMCFGQDWDPQTRKYSKRRNYVDNEPPEIPHDFSLLVRKSLHDSLDIIKQQSRSDDVEKILPIMDPDICIVNFYSTTGRLGLHQDRDESRESISRGLPVVSFSIGDSAEFLYGEKRDVDKAERVLLESGDVLIFGGSSRLIFHGVASVLSKTAPKELVEQAKMRPGRLNLTFRKY